MTKSEKEKYELIEKFIENTLSKEELATFNAALKNDPEFVLEVEAHKEVHGLLLDQGILNIKEKLQKIHHTETKGGTNYKLYAFIAALLLTAGTLLYFYNSTKTDEVKIKEPVSQTTSSTPSNKNEDVSPAATDVIQNVTASGTSNKKKDNGGNTQQKITVSNPSVQSGQTDPVSQSPSNDPIATGGDNTPAPSDPNVSSKTTNNPASKSTVIDCSTIKITGNGTAKESCKDENTGSIVVHLNSIKGGTAPYKFSVTNEDDFTTASLFDQLGVGIYKLYIKDANSCVSIIKELTVESKDCFKSDIFFPERSEWPLPLKNNEDAKLQIFNRAGAMVYTINISNGYPNTWNGTDNNGQLLPMGNYSYIILYNDDTVTRGSVTIAK